MLNATVSSCVLEAVVAPTTTFDSDALLHVEPDRIEIHATDKSREAIVEITASEAAFDSYCGEEMVCGIDLSKIARFLNLADDTDLIQIDIDAELGWVTLTAGALSYMFPLVDADGVPRVSDSLDAEQPAVVAVPGRKLDVPTELATIAGWRIRLRVDSGATTFSGTTDDAWDTLCFEFGETDIDRVQGSAAGLPISLDNFAPIQRVIPADTQVQLELGNREHVRLQYPIADGEGIITATFAGIPV